ncbi:hypothetical protein JCM21900_001022 [Sporobolomyces salmonicolor]
MRASSSFSLVLCCAALLLPSAVLAFVPLDSSLPWHQREAPLRTVTMRNLFGFVERRTISPPPAQVVWDPSRAANLVNEVFVRRRRPASRLSSQRPEEDDHRRRRLPPTRQGQEGELAEGDEEEDDLDEEDGADDQLEGEGEGEGEGDSEGADGWYKRRIKRRRDLYATSQSRPRPRDGQTAARGR